MADISGRQEDLNGGIIQYFERTHNIYVSYLSGSSGTSGWRVVKDRQ